MKTLFNTLFLLSAVGLFAQKPITVATTIKNVTIYESGAQVERTGKTQLPKGTCHVQFTDLPVHLNRDQIQFNATGDLKIQSSYFTYRNDTLNKAELHPSIDIKASEVTISAKQKQIQEIDGRIAIYQREENLLQQNSDFKSTTDGVDVDRLEKAATLLRTRYLELHRTLLTLNNEKQQLTEEINQLQLERNKVQRVEIERWLELHVIAVTSKPTKASFRISYQSKQAGWSPFYDARVNTISEPIQLDYQAKVFQQTGEDWKDVTLTLSTGKPQQNYSKPALAPWIIGAITPPPPPARRPAPAQTSANGPNNWLLKQGYDPRVKEVSGQVIDAATGEALPFVNVLITGTSSGTTTDFDGRYRLAIPNNSRTLEYTFVGYQRTVLNVSNPVMNVYLNAASVELSSVEIRGARANSSVSRIDAQNIGLLSGTSRSRTKFKKNRAGRGSAKVVEAANEYTAIRAAYSPTNVRFTAELPYSIPANGQEYVVHLSGHELNVEYEYACSPKIDSRVYLTARIVDWEELDLLEGNANVYFEGTFVGQTAIDPSFADDTLAISLGVDEAVRVQRTRVKTGSKKQFLSTVRKDSREWRIEVRNNKTSPITLKLEDQIPVSNAENIEVSLTKDSGAQHSKKAGRLTWDLELAPSTKQEVEFRYTVERPRDVSIILE